MQLLSPTIMRWVILARKVCGYFHTENYGDNRVEIDKELCEHVRLNIKGHNNLIHLSHIACNPYTYIYIQVEGSYNKIFLDQVYVGEELRIILGQEHPYFGRVKNTILEVGKGGSIEGLTYISYNSFATCKIGNDCMFSSNITLFNTDAHPIISRDSGKVINWVEGITIGDHCWIGQGAAIMKNSSIPDDCIIGYNAVVSGKLPEPHSIYAGNPAKFIKSGVTWDPNGASRGYIENSGRQG